MTLKTKDQGLKTKGSDGITLLLVMVILSALLSIGVGIFNIALGQLKISGELSDSFIAFYAADQGIERTLFMDRVIGNLCPGAGERSGCFIDSNVAVDSGGCYTVRVSKTASNETEIVASGQYRCGVNADRVVKRGFLLIYADTGAAASLNPITRWAMEETVENTCGGGLDVCDTAGGGNHGDNSSVSIAINGGLNGTNARSFDGSNWDQLSNPDILSSVGTNDFTIGFWIKIASSKLWDFFVQKQRGGGLPTEAYTTIGVYNYTAAGPGTLQFAIQRVTGAGVVPGQSHSTPLPLAYITDNQFHYLTFVRQNTTLKSYVDGAEINSTSGPLVDINGVGSFNVGSYLLGVRPSFVGTMDQLEIYDQALTTIQICDIFKDQSGLSDCGPPSSLVLFDDFSDNNFNASPAWEEIVGGMWNASGGALTSSKNSAEIKVPSTQAYGIWQFDLQSTAPWYTMYCFIENAGRCYGPGGNLSAGFAVYMSGIEVGLLHLDPGVIGGTSIITSTGITPGSSKHTIKVIRSTGGDFALYYDGTLVGAAKDTSYPTSGWMGVYSNNGGAPSTVDNIFLSP